MYRQCFRRTWLSFIPKRSMCKVPSEDGPPVASLSARYKPSELQKFILVWTKKFKTKDDIPKYISADLIQRSRSEARIKLSNILIILTALASFGAILSGKAAAKRGESVHQMNLDWHKKYQEEHKQKEEAAAASAK